MEGGFIRRHLIKVSCLVFNRKKITVVRILVVHLIPELHGGILPRHLSVKPAVCLEGSHVLGRTVIVVLCGNGTGIFLAPQIALYILFYLVQGRIHAVLVLLSSCLKNNGPRLVLVFHRIVELYIGVCLKNRIISNWRKRILVRQLTNIVGTMRRIRRIGTPALKYIAVSTDGRQKCVYRFIVGSGQGRRFRRSPIALKNNL